MTVSNMTLLWALRTSLATPCVTITLCEARDQEHTNERFQLQKAITSQPLPLFSDDYLEVIQKDIKIFSRDKSRTKSHRVWHDIPLRAEKQKDCPPPPISNRGNETYFTFMNAVPVRTYVSAVPDIHRWAPSPPARSARQSYRI